MAGWSRDLSPPLVAIFYLAFKSKWKIDLRLIISYLHQKPFVVSVPLLSSQMFTAKLIGLAYAISVVNWIFGMFY